MCVCVVVYVALCVYVVYELCVFQCRQGRSTVHAGLTRGACAAGISASPGDLCQVGSAGAPSARRRPPRDRVRAYARHAGCVCARTFVCSPFFSLARWRAGARALSLSRSPPLFLSISRSLCRLRACVRASMCVPQHLPLRPLALRAENLGTRQILWAFKRGQIEPPECCLLNSRPRAYFQGDYESMRLIHGAADASHPFIIF